MKIIGPQLIDFPLLDPFVIMRIQDWVYLFDPGNGRQIGKIFSPLLVKKGGSK